MEKIKSKLVLLTILMLLMFSISYAQNNNLKKYQKLLKQKLTVKLEISDTLADKYFEFFKISRNEIKKLNKERNETMEAIEENPESLDINAKIERLLEIDQSVENSKKDFIKNLKTIFTPAQIAKTIIFQRNLQKFLKNQIKE